MRVLVTAVTLLVCWSSALASLVFFNGSQSYSYSSADPQYDIVISEGYHFQYTMDKYWSSYAGGPPTGRFSSVFWPQGLHAQAVTSGPNFPDPLQGAEIIITRQDNQPFDIEAFSFQLRANTWATGGSIEIMPSLLGNDDPAGPYFFNASGSAGQSFSYTTGSLVNADTYQIHLFVDFALTGLTAYSPADPIPEPTALGMALMASSLMLRRCRQR